MNNTLKFFKRTDILIVLVILAVSVTSFLIYRNLNQAKHPIAEIYYYSTLVETVELDTGQEKIFSIPQNKNVVFHLYPDGEISFEESDCPDKVCIRTGKLHTVGQSAACLPNGIILKIVPEGKRSENDIDITAGN